MKKSTAYIANIGPRGRRRRMAFGIGLLVLSALLAASMIHMHAPRFWLAVLFLPCWLGALGVFQAVEQTCVALVLRGQRDMDEGPEAISNGAELDQMRRQARQIQRKALAVAFALTALALLVPL